MFKDLILKNRSYRRFYEDAPVTEETLLELIELARLSPTGGNRQTLKFYLSAGDKNDEIFNCLGWAGYLEDGRPEPGERPAAYVVILNDADLGGGAETNAGIAAAGMLLGAVELGLGGCMFGSVNREKLARELNLANNLEIILVVAFGAPKETVVLEEVKDDGDIKYWRDEYKVHHVPKRKLEDIIVRSN